MKRFIAIILTLTLLFSLGIGASATWGIEAKELYYRGISIYVNGTELIPQDVNGDSTEPFIIEGTTYLPVRALAGALGLSVGWDGSTNTITLTSGAEVNMGSGEASKTKEIVNADVYYKDVKIFLDGAELIPTDVTGKYVEPFLMGGSTYLPLRAIATALGLEVGWDEKTNTITLDESDMEDPEMVWRLVKQTVTTTVDNGYMGSEDMILETEYLYSELGRFLGMFISLDEFRIVDLNCTYTQSGNLETLSMITEDEYILLSFEYKSSSNKPSKITATLNGEFLAASKFRYDAQDRIDAEYSLNATGGTVSSTVYSYDENGNCFRMDTHETYAEPLDGTSVIRSFDDEGRILSEKCTVSDADTENGTIVITTIYEAYYSYDQHGNLISLSYTGAESEYTFSAEYDEQGREISSTTIISAPGYKKTTTSTQWSEDGLSATITSKTGSVVTVEVITWSVDGRVLRSELSGDNYSIVTEYEYALYPYCDEDQLINELLALLGYSR